MPWPLHKIIDKSLSFTYIYEEEDQKKELGFLQTEDTLSPSKARWIKNFAESDLHQLEKVFRFSKSGLTLDVCL